MADKEEVDELLDRFLEGRRPEEIIGRDGLLDTLTKRLMERAFSGRSHRYHLGYDSTLRRVVTVATRAMA